MDAIELRQLVSRASANQWTLEVTSAQDKLTRMAIEAGYDKSEVKSASDWDRVAWMITNPKPKPGVAFTTEGGFVCGNPREFTPPPVEHFYSWLDVSRIAQESFGTRTDDIHRDIRHYLSSQFTGIDRGSLYRIANAVESIDSTLKSLLNVVLIATQPVLQEVYNSRQVAIRELWTGFRNMISEQEKMHGVCPKRVLKALEDEFDNKVMLYVHSSYNVRTIKVFGAIPLSKVDSNKFDKPVCSWPIVDPKNLGRSNSKIRREYEAWIATMVDTPVESANADTSRGIASVGQPDQVS